ncbi:MAG: carbon monoxide dehydrogenase subunit G [Pseudomonadota bacterium]
MEITGNQAIAAPRQAVWDALNDPAILKACLPGCESVIRTSAEEFKVVMAASIGPLRARFNGVLRMTESLPPQSCTMVFEGQGGAVGFGKGSSSVTLGETATGTELAYTAQAQVGGKLAQVGSRLIDGVARKMADDFFNAFRRQLEPASAAAPVAPAVAARVAPASGAAAAVPAAAPAPAAVPVTVSPPPAMPPQAPATAPGPGTVTLVPGWWLAVATVLGAAAALAGVFLAR